MRRLILSGLGVLSVCGLFAQHTSISDTIMLDEVTSYAAVKKYQAGAKLESISNEQLQFSQEGGLDHVLMRFTPIYIKSNAGGLSTIRIRGTAPDHTSINFGGININSLTLGHSNMSSIPTYLFDGLSLQYGSSSAVNGSGSIGGSIYLGMNGNWTDGLKVKATVSQGSFGEQLYGTKIFTGNGKFEAVTRAYYYFKENNFPFQNIYTGDIENRNPIDDTQHGASVENMGIVQELNYRFHQNEYLKSAIWLEHNWNQIQPNMQSNIDYTTTEDLDNKHVRAWVQYRNDKNELRYLASLGYVHDKQVYNKDNSQQIGTDRLIADLELKQDFNSNFGYRGGIKYKYIVPEVYAYSSENIDFEQQLDVFASSFFTAWNKLKLTINLRQMFVTDFSAPFTPSLGAEYRLYTNDVSVFKLNGNISRSYRIPTFNDRYWGTQGNPNLKPEEGTNYELGLDYTFCNDNFQSNLKLNAFYMDIKNWIEWRNFGVWQAQNLMEVVSKGIEFQSNTTITKGAIEYNLRANYNYNPVEAVETNSQTGVTGQQLIYVPKHMANAFLMMKYKEWQIYADGSYTGSRFSDDIGYELDSYFLTNCGFVRQLKINKHQFRLSLSINNLLDVNYQNERYYAMPGRNFRVSISTNLNII
ncbi:TonB-dependent receptor [Sunxiuqinia sp. A32]|uniref:TonB-dependent receptor n=1 Tax=Sunxiuqinia sp. A32 TaxID=3461496 RepID=UPI004046659C